MSLKTTTFASALLACCMIVSSSEAQLVRKLGNLPLTGKVSQAALFSNGCDSCGVESCDGCGPSCGMAGSILGESTCCGHTGLGYGGGFGLCGGSCDGCGDAGYLGRNLKRVAPCACGGSLVGDMACGLLGLADRAVGATVTTVFGGLQRVTCHAAGTFAALECAAASACNSCGLVGCGGCCSTWGSTDTGCSSCDGGTISEEYVPSSAPAGNGVPTPAQPNDAADPFLDDSAPTPEARLPRGYRNYGTPNLVPPRAAMRLQSVNRAAYSAPISNRYQLSNGRPITLRR